MADATMYLDNQQETQPARSDSKSPLGCLQEAVRQYQLQSPNHFELELEVKQACSPHGKSPRTNTKSSTLTLLFDVLFHGTNIEGFITIPAQCRLQGSGRRSRKRKWRCLSVFYNGPAEDIQSFLTSKFPVIDAPLRPDTLCNWWLSNGKSFNWSALPTELKERVVEHCMRKPRTHGVYSERLARFKWRYKNDHHIREPGPFEIVEQLGDWFQLLYVSHQTRAITLRLCITGGSTLTHSEGLCITASSYNGLSSRLSRLGDYYQMTSPNSVPTSAAEEILSKTYERFPHIYPDLSRFATLRHGIQKISFSMDWLSFMHFFKVATGGFDQYHKLKALTYEVFERLPCLNEVVVRLPLRPYGGWRDKPGQCGPLLWHDDSPCPRIMHRVIYERIAEVLAPYNVTVRNFIDYAEMRQYEAARTEAVKALKFTKVELEELYADDGGGIDLLDGEKERSTELEMIRCKVQEQEADTKYVQADFFPPLCHCDEPCILARVLAMRKH